METSTQHADKTNNGNVRGCDPGHTTCESVDCAAVEIRCDCGDGSFARCDDRLEETTATRKDPGGDHGRIVTSEGSL